MRPLDRRNLLKTIAVAPVVLVAGQQTTSSAAQKAEGSSQGLAPIDVVAMDRAGENSRLFAKNGSPATFMVDGKPTTSTWVAELPRNQITCLRSTDPKNANFTFLAYPNSTGVKILSREGHLYTLEKGAVYGDPSDKYIPSPDDFRRGSNVLNGIMQSKEYRQDTEFGTPAQIQGSQFKVVADAIDMAKNQTTNYPTSRQLPPIP
jgi:hypothetical protein